MKKCPEKQILYLFLDSELEDKELASVKAHLEKCSKCQKEVQTITDSENSLRIEINDLFLKHRVSSKILNEIRLVGEPDKLKNESVKLASSFGFGLKALFAGLVFLFVLILWPENPVYHGSVSAVSCHALDDKSTVDKQIKLPEQRITFEKQQPMLLEGNFVFSVVATHTTEFSMNGKAMVEVKNTFSPIFSKANVELSWISGPEIELNVNSQKLIVKPEKAEEAHIEEQKLDIIATSTVDSAVNDCATTTTFVECVIATPSVPASIAKQIPASAALILSASETPVINAEDNSEVESDVLNKNPFSEEPLRILGN